ncbi:AraC family transcriptional regulator [Pendulispora albinea]|uniref:Helix-turn-helix transcriptional regulator n=1 Tax=Pendulispora albinea TaxID=2741071 RepID=A0ABZ2LLD7_9BACT
MRNASYREDYDRLPQAIIAIGNEYPANHVVQPHSHRRSQLLYSASGMMRVTTEHGAWMVPPERAVWLPAGELHSVQLTMGPLTTSSVYILPDAAPGLPTTCQVVGMWPLMRCLLLEAIDVPLSYDPPSRDGLVMALLLQELRRLKPVLPPSLPFPRDEKLGAICNRMLEQPSAHDTIDHVRSELGMSRRAFTRLFRVETGMSFAAWRQQACLFAAMPRLATGEAVTTVALELGYESPAAFTSMFKRMLGAPPSRYFQSIGAPLRGGSEG